MSAGYQSTGHLIRQHVGQTVGGLPVYQAGQLAGDLDANHCVLTIRNGIGTALDANESADRVWFGNVEVVGRFKPGTNPKVIDAFPDALDDKFFDQEMFNTDGDRILFRDGGVRRSGPSGDWHQINYLCAFERDRFVS